MLNKFYSLLVVLFLVLIITYPGWAEENQVGTQTDSQKSSETILNNNNNEEETISKNKWSETLRLRDFTTLPGFLDLQERLEQYELTLEKNYRKHPNVFSTAVEYGLLLNDLGETEKSVQVWDRAIKDFVNNPTPKIYKTWVDALNGNYKAAKDVCYSYLKEQIDTGINSALWLPHHADCAVELSIIQKYLPEKDKIEANEVVNEIARHFASNPKFASVLITNDLQAGKLKSAMKKINKVLEKHPNEPVIITLQGITELISENPENALKLLEKSNEIYPYSPTNHLMRARVMLVLKKKKESNLLYEQALKFDPSLGNKSLKKKVLLAQQGYIMQLNKNSKDIKKDKEKDIKELKETKKQDNMTFQEIN